MREGEIHFNLSTAAICTHAHTLALCSSRLCEFPHASQGSMSRARGLNGPPLEIQKAQNTGADHWGNQRQHARPEREGVVWGRFSVAWGGWFLKGAPD